MITEAIKEHPILFSSPMMRAILANKKTQTRRVIPSGWWRCLDPEDSYDRARAILQCPYGQVGDRLWVRETTIIAPKHWNDRSDYTCRDADGDKRIVQYLATNPDREAANDYKLKATPSIFMPRWASRITLEITDVRIERLQNITQIGAEAEGVERQMIKYGLTIEFDSHRDAFIELWDTINLKRGCGWNANGFVWVLSFKRVDGEVK